MRLMITWLLILLLPLTGLAEELHFTQGQPHNSHLDYRQYFETMSAAVGECTLSIAKDAYTEEIAAQLHARLAADEAVLAAFAPVQPHTVYVVKKPMAGMQRIDSAIYCTVEQMLDGSYRSWLAQAAFQKERWQGVGLAGCAFGVDVDETALSAWYADDQHDDMLTMFPAYFVEAFSTPEELCMAEQTAIALFGYMVEQVGVDVALAADASAHVQGWLSSIGVERDYADPYAGVLDGYTWTHNQFYALIGTSPKGDVFKLNPLEYDMTTPRQVRQALCELELGVDVILAGVKQNAPDWYDRLAKNYEAPITYEFKENNNASVTHFTNRRVDVGAAVSLIHETAHMMTPCKIDRISRYMDQWKAEAIAEYLTLTYYPCLSEKETVWNYLQEEAILALDDPEERAYWEKSREVYLRYAPLPQNPEDVNAELYWRADVMAIQELEMELRTISDVYSGAGSASLDEVNGNELSYIEGEWLASYLINRYGLSTFLHYCLDEGVTFAEAFGMPYQEAKADWLQHRSILD